MDQPCESDGGSDAPPSSEAGKDVAVEVEIPNEAIVSAAMAAEEEVKSYVCRECNVSFSSGKALGGHRSSAHVQANKDHARKKVKKNLAMNNPSAAAAASSGGEYLCEMCGKAFKSSKSLYGHMRCHPDRQWRGMEPPPTQLPPRPYDDDVEEPLEEEEEMGRAADTEGSNCNNGPFLNAWARKNKRGANIRPDVFAALQLLNMRNTCEEIVAKTTTKNMSSPVARCGPESSIPIPTGYLKKKLKNEKWVSSTKDTNCEAPSSVVGDKIREKAAVAARISVIPRDMIVCGGDGDDGKEASHVCGECNKRFKSYQALGGHKSSHYKRIVRIVNTEDEEMEEFDLNRMPEQEEDDGEAS